jgi:hypothetical protein
MESMVVGHGREAGGKPSQVQGLILPESYFINFSGLFDNPKV